MTSEPPDDDRERAWEAQVRLNLIVITINLVVTIINVLYLAHVLTRHP